MSEKNVRTISIIKLYNYLQLLNYIITCFPLMCEINHKILEITFH